MPTPNNNKSSLDSVLRAILSVAKQEQSTFYPPHVYSEQRNIVESLLLSELVKQYPLNQQIVDMITPFVKVEVIKVTDGYIQLPDDYRNILGSPVVFANQSSTGECGNIIEPLTANAFKSKVLKSGCLLNPVIILPQSEFAYRTTSSYDKPTWSEPIGEFIDSNKIKVCPYDISKVGVLYVRKETEVRYGYITQPDDTYLYDPATTVETQFGSNAYEPIFNAMVALYSAYSKDQQMQNWSLILKERGIL